VWAKALQETLTADYETSLDLYSAAAADGRINLDNVLPPTYLRTYLEMGEGETLDDLGLSLFEPPSTMLR
jgi:hypothetical protein